MKEFFMANEQILTVVGIFLLPVFFSLALVIVGSLFNKKLRIILLMLFANILICVFFFWCARELLLRFSNLSEFTVNCIATAVVILQPFGFRFRKPHSLRNSEAKTVDNSNTES